MEWKIPSFLLVLFLAFSIVSPFVLSEDVQSTVTVTAIAVPPSITIDEPRNRTTYNTNSIDVDVDVEDENDTFSCNISEDGNLLKQIVNATDTANYSTTITKPDGSHNVSVYCEDDGGLNSTSSVYYSIETSPIDIAGRAGIFLAFIPLLMMFSIFRYIARVDLKKDPKSAVTAGVMIAFVATISLAAVLYLAGA